MISFLAVAIKPATGAEIISDIRISNRNEIGSATVSWITNELSTATVGYKTQDEEFKEAVDTKTSKIHYVKIEGLTPNTEYLFYIKYHTLTFPLSYKHLPLSFVK